MKIFYKVHGFVQGVGYRYHVVEVAKRHGIKGFVRNAADGSVEILASGDEKNLKLFEKGIEVRDKYGPNVVHLEKYIEGEASFPSNEDEQEDFEIRR